MKTKLALLAVVLCAFAVVSFAGDSNVGTWKLNEAKSKIPAGSPKNTSVVYADAGDSVKATVDGVDGTGKATHNEWTGKFDGKDYPLVGDPNADTRAIKKVDDRHYTINNKKNGKVTTSGTIVYSPDFKTRTLTTTSTDAKGKKTEATFVYEKQ